MYPDSGYKLAHAQSVCTGPFFPRWEGPGDEASALVGGRVPHTRTICSFSGSLATHELCRSLLGPRSQILSWKYICCSVEPLEHA